MWAQDPRFTVDDTNEEWAGETRNFYFSALTVFDYGADGEGHDVSDESNS